MNNRFTIYILLFLALVLLIIVIRSQTQSNEGYLVTSDRYNPISGGYGKNGLVYTSC